MRMAMKDIATKLDGKEYVPASASVSASLSVSTSLPHTLTPSLTSAPFTRRYVIPKGDIVITSPAVASRMESVFARADAFEPERFGPERNEQKTPFAYLGFGGGLHQCMGQQFGLLQVKTIMSVLLRNYRFEKTTTAFPEPDYTAMVVGPKNHCKVKYTKIN